MHARVVEVMFTALHAYGPKMPMTECKKQDVINATHDYRILAHILAKGNEEEGKSGIKDTQTFFLEDRSERSFTFSLWMKTDKDIKTEVKVTWDCFSTRLGKIDMAEKVKRGEDVLPIESVFSMYRKQGEISLQLRYREERRTDNDKKKALQVVGLARQGRCTHQKHFHEQRLGVFLFQLAYH
jgi:hypothetical protein